MKRLLLALLALVAVSPAFAQADTGYPDKPVRLIVPFPAGSAIDIVSRLMAQKFSEKLGQHRDGHQGAVRLRGISRCHARPKTHTSTSC